MLGQVTFLRPHPFYFLPDRLVVASRSYKRWSVWKVIFTGPVLLAASESLVRTPGKVITCSCGNSVREMMEPEYIFPKSETRQLFDSPHCLVCCESIDTISTEIHLIEVAVFVRQLGAFPVRSLTNITVHISDTECDLLTRDSHVRIW